MKTGLIPGTEPWRKAREKYLGASEAYDVVFRPAMVYARKVGELQPETETEAMVVGTIMEPAVAKLYATLQGVEVQHPVPMHVHDDVPYLAASPDALRADGRYVQIKWSTSPKVARELGDEGTDWIPERWLFQVQQEMDVTATEEIDVAVLLWGRLRVYRVKRNGDLIGVIHDAAEELHQQIESRTPPTLDYSDPEALSMAQERHGLHHRTAALTGSVCGDVARDHEIGKELKRLEAERKSLRAKIVDAMGGADHAITLEGDYEVRRTAVEESLYAQEDVEKVRQKVGQVKRRGYERIVVRSLSDE